MEGSCLASLTIIIYFLMLLISLCLFGFRSLCLSDHPHLHLVAPWMSPPVLGILEDRIGPSFFLFVFYFHPAFLCLHELNNRSMCLLCLEKLSRRGSKELHGLTADRRIKLTSCLRARSDVFWVFEVFSDWNFPQSLWTLLGCWSRREKFSVCVFAVWFRGTIEFESCFEQIRKSSGGNEGVGNVNYISTSSTLFLRAAANASKLLLPW